MTEFILVRHGETDWNRENRWQGFADIHLNDNGRQQAHAAAHALRGVALQAVFTSDLVRAYETACIMTADLGLPLQTDERLREICVGDWEGLTTKDIRDRDLETYERLQTMPFMEWRPPNGESRGEVVARASAALADYSARYPEGLILVVTHGGVIRSLVYYLINPELEFRVENCSFTRLAYQHGNWQARYVGLPPHEVEG
jgi:probable phosphoglycerate mutase